MESQRTGTYEPSSVATTDGGRVVDSYTTGTRAAGGYGPASRTGENVMTVRDRVQWGPILAGLLSAIATLVVMTVLGIALGASVLDRDASGGEISTWAGVWGAISLIFSFFVGGWMAAKTAAVGGPFAGLMNGFTVGAAALTLILWLTASGVGNLFGTVSQNLGDIVNVAQDQAQQQGVTAQDAQQQAQDAQGQAQQAATQAEETARGAFDEVRDGAWGTLGGILLALGAATLGGYLGHNKRRELIEGTG